MPRRASAAASNIITIGFIGVGAVDEEAVVNLIADWAESRAKNDEEIHFILPITEGNFTDTLGFIAGFAKQNELAYEAVIEVAPSTAAKSIKSYITDAAKTHKVEDAEAKVVDLLKTAPGAALFVLFDSDEQADEDFESAIETLAMDAIDADIPAFDLTDALTQLQAAPDGEGAEAEPEAETEETGEVEDEDFDDLIKHIAEQVSEAIPELITAAFESFSANGNGKAEPEPEAPAPRRGRRTAAAEPAEAPAPRRASRARKAAEAEEPAPRRSPGRPRKDGTPAQPRIPNKTGRLVRSSS